MGDKAMPDKRGGSISEEDVFVILQRYTTTTVLTLLHEVAQVQDVKIDWDALVKKTKTGITNPREYQMLWRHIAYCDPLIEKLEDDAEPLDDDSDLEYELEVFPTVSNEASAEAAAYVKVLMASGSPSGSSLEKGSTVEAPLAINIPRVQSTRHPSDDTQLACSTNGVNITIPVSVPSLALPTVSSAEAMDTNACANSNLPSRRKRKPWSAAEDDQLFAAVQKCGEGNWANISKSDFKGDRTASQLSQRWSVIKKRQSNLNMKTGSQLSKAQLAARRALNMALDKPGVDNPKAASSQGVAKSGNISVQPTVAEPLPSIRFRQNQSQQDPKRSFPRTQPFPRRPLPKPLPLGADAVKAAAVAAGARIATQSAAAIILNSQLKTAIHIKKCSNGNSRPPTPGAHMGSDYFRDRYPSISPKAPRPNLCLSHGNTNVRPVGPLNQSTSLDMIASSETCSLSEDQSAVSSSTKGCSPG